jgi:hypothetical protein
MRSRPKVSVYLSPAVATPGEQLEVDCRVEALTETPVDWISITLEGVTFTAVGSGQYRSVAKVSHYKRAWRSEPATLVPGTYRHRVSFDLPESLPASYGVSDDARIAYVVTVRVSIPWWPDRVSRFVVPVAAREGPAPRAVPATLSTTGEGPRGTKPFMEVSLATTELAPADFLAGSVSLANLGGRRVRGLVGSLVEIESLTEPVVTRRECRRFNFRLHDGEPPENQAIAFRLRVPAAATPTFGTPSVGVSSHLEIRADVAWGEDIVLRPALTIVPRSSAPRAAAEWVAPVGRDKRMRVWKRVADATAFVLDPEGERLVGSRGAVNAEIRTEQRDGDFWLVANLAYPSLGLELSIAPREWTDALAMNVIRTGDPRVDDKLSAHAREHPQASAVVTSDFLALLLPFEQLAVADAAARLAIRGGAHDADSVRSFATQVLEVAGALDAAAQRIPPPAMFASDLAAWSAAAAGLRGRLEPGRMWIHDGSIGTDRVTLGTVWAKSGVLLGTALHVAIDPPLERAPSSPDDPAISPAARGLWRELASRAASLAVTSSGLDVELAGKLADPAVAMPIVEIAVSLRRALAGVQGAGPFR